MKDLLRGFGFILLLLASTAFGCRPATDAGPAPGPARQEISPSPDSAPRARSIEKNINLKELADSAFAGAPHMTDWSFPVYRGKKATVHMHVMGKTQICPMHFHSTFRECSIIVEGRAAVRDRYGDGGQIREKSLLPAPGDLHFSDVFSGHEFANRSADTYLAVLVISSPEFFGNLYVRDQDNRLLQGAESQVRSLASVSGEVSSGRAPFWIEPLPLFPSMQTAHLQVAQSYKTTTGSLSFFYVVAGSGLLTTSAGESVALSGQRAILVRPGFEIALTAKEGQPLSIFSAALPPEEPAS